MDIPPSNDPQAAASSLGSSPIPVLGYAMPADISELPSGPRPWWVYGVVALYLLLLAALLSLPIWMGLFSDDSVILPSAIFAGVLAACGFALVILPVRAVRRRPVRRRTIWIPVLVSGLLAGAMVFGAGLALLEYLKVNGDAALWGLWSGAVLVWGGWSVLFMMMGFRRGPASIGMKLHRLLIAGSVLELLVAVPAHVVVRRRPECCAGIGTGIGICLGVGVMFVSFGPSVLLLFHQRRKRITPPESLNRES